MRAVLLTVVASVGLVACVGSLDTGGNTIGPGTNPNPQGSNSMAQQMFEQNVYPIIHSPGAASDCSSCHDSKAPQGNVTGFVSANLGDAYATITSFQTVVGNFTPAAAGILLRIAPTDAHMTQRGRMFTDAQKQAITDWLNQELVERGNGTGTGSGTTTETPEQATARLLNQWTACMSLTTWQTDGMTTAWGNMQTNNGSACRSCHATGGQGMMISNVESSVTGGPPGMWTVNSTMEAYMVEWFSVDFTGATPQVIINTTSFMGVSNGMPPHAEHPTFDATNNDGMTALQKFYTDTMTALPGCTAAMTKLVPPAS